MQYTTQLRLAVSLAVLLACNGHAAGVRVTVTNPSSFDRRSETVELRWANLVSMLPGLTTANAAVFRGKTQIPSQILDTDGDGRPDQLLFQVDLRAKKQQQVEVRAVQVRRQFPSRVDARYELPREDVAWESDRIAFRIYGPALAAEVNNGIDIWVKRVRSLIVDKWYSESALQKKDTYHEDHGEGADFFSVGRSLGAGGSTIAKDGVLYQPGVYTTQKILATGPIRAMFTVTYAKGAIDGIPYTEEKTFTIDAGQNLNRIVASFSRLPTSDSLRVVAGLVKRNGVIVHYDSSACALALWGPVNDDPINGDLGTAIVFPRQQFAGMADQKDQYLLLSAVPPGGTFTYFAGAGWTRSGDFASVQDWMTLLTQWSRRISEPVSITLNTIR
jgi:pectinesterase